MSTRKTWNVPPGRLFSVPVPEETRTYKPISHKELDRLTRKALKKEGFEIKSREYSSAMDGMIGNGKYLIDNVSDDEMALEIGWQNSYNKRLTVKFAIGTRIFICDNGCVSGDFGSFKKKHMGDIEEFTPDMIGELIKNARDVFERMQYERDQMKKSIIDKQWAAEIIGRLYIDENLIKPNTLTIIKNEIEKPSHDYKAKDSLWELYNHVTFALKSLHPTLWMETQIDVHNFFNKILKEMDTPDIIDIPITYDTPIMSGQVDLIDSIEEVEKELENELE